MGKVNGVTDVQGHTPQPPSLPQGKVKAAQTSGPKVLDSGAPVPDADILAASVKERLELLDEQLQRSAERLERLNPKVDHHLAPVQEGKDTQAEK